MTLAMAARIIVNQKASWPSHISQGIRGMKAPTEKQMKEEIAAFQASSLALFLPSIHPEPRFSTP